MAARGTGTAIRGARCDVESSEYSYQFSDELQQDWDWSERYAPQPEILAYAEHVADRFKLRDGIRFDTLVVAATFDEDNDTWTIETDAGERLTARYCVMATGCLSCANVPEIDGRDGFDGDWYHTGDWPHEGVDFTGRTVAVVGTGSSAIQSIPVIAEQARHLYVFQRTPNYAVPARNRQLSDEERDDIKARYPELRALEKSTRNGTRYEVSDVKALDVSANEREATYREMWEYGGLRYMTAFGDLLLNGAANDTAAEFIRERIRETVDDPEVAERLCPTSVVGCKRLCVDTDYYKTYNRANVTLIDIGDAPIERIAPDGPIAGGDVYKVDVIVFATGFDAMTGALSRINIRGRDGLALQQKWAEGPKTYLGLTVSGFPNLFMITGPGSPSVLTNMLPSIEQHVELIADMISRVEERGSSTIEATSEAEAEWGGHVNQLADATLYPTCNSWYLGVNIPGKPRVFMPYLGYQAYQTKCREVVEKGLDGFAVG